MNAISYLNRLQRTGGFLVAVLLGILLLGAINAESAPQVDISFGQAGIKSVVYVNITNPDATYDSGVFKFDEVLMPVAQAVQDNNASYTNSSLNEIMGEWRISIQPNEVYSGWSVTRNDACLDLTNEDGRNTHKWLKTSEDDSKDEFCFSVNFDSQLDFDGNGVYEGVERLVQLDSVVSDGFVGILDELNAYPTDVNQIGTVHALTPKEIWLNQHNIVRMEDDNDGDGFNNLCEYNFDTNPTNQNFYPQIHIDGTEISFFGSTNSEFNISYKSDLSETNWVPVGSAITGSHDLITFADSSASTQSFFNVQAARIE